MNVNKLITDTLSPFGYPVEQDVYEKVNPEEDLEDTYFVYTYADERAISFANNKPQKERVEMYISLYIPKDVNCMKLKTDVRKALFDAGFTYPSVEQGIIDNIRHIVFDCEIDGIIEI